MGCFVNRDLADYDAPAHAEIPAIKVHFLPELDDKCQDPDFDDPGGERMG